MPAPRRKKRTSANDDSGLAFNHAMLYARDVARARHFYVDLLGFTPIDEFRHGGILVYARIRSPRGNSTLALHMLEPGKTFSDDEGVRLYFEVRNLESFCKKLEAAGITLDQQPKMLPWGWKHAYLSDPDGHELSLYWAGVKRFQGTTS